MRLQGWLRSSIWVETLTYRLLKSWSRGLSSLCNYLFSFLLLRIKWVSIMASHELTPTLLLSHFSRHHVFNVFIGMEVVVDLLMVQSHLYHVKLVRALDILELCLHFLLLSIIASTPLHFTKLSLTLLNLAVSMLLKYIVCLWCTVLF